ncbi:glycine C-acetyltransferase [Desulfomonile tiedjei]|uniref:2-amino-3-ketobutyrate coenzyme A ligase n=1 Tax=Desulfomonile tiedjei (strain ATCC 49306 / DSM 6799 / DCB-1) TaxID=706587 RepID=I4CEA2_DESTA|nr:glycine C-acetyltransferase [Desulfomonile tiedjei]AFM27893.1 2-amino-3-ketobutyrate coenzyme A ligase [Desulfomonile tiedjei DSM 6799]
MHTMLASILETELQEIRSAGLYKEERVIQSRQGAHIQIPEREVINLCANNYLGLSSHPEIIKAAHRGLDERGYGMSSVRFICGTQDIHKELEKRISEFLGTDDTILYSSCFDANGGLFETLLGKDDVVISDALNHASIIDGVRLSKAARKVYRHADMDDLEVQLKDSAEFRVRMIATDGVFSMDGDLAHLDKICDLAERYNAVVMVDDSHATGFVGSKGKGTPEHFGVTDRVDIITSTLGKALGGASGGFTSGRGSIVKFLRQRSRPYLFSNTLAPPIVYATLTALNMIDGSDDLRRRLKENTEYFRQQIETAGFDIRKGSHPIIPIMLGDARLAQDMARELLDEGIYVVGFSYPVVPKDKARIRVQISAAHTREELDRAVKAFTLVGRKHGLI